MALDLATSSSPVRSEIWSPGNLEMRNKCGQEEACACYSEASASLSPVLTAMHTSLLGSLEPHLSLFASFLLHLLSLTFRTDGCSLVLLILCMASGWEVGLDQEWFCLLGKICTWAAGEIWGWNPVLQELLFDSFWQYVYFTADEGGRG